MLFKYSIYIEMFNRNCGHQFSKKKIIIWIRFLAVLYHYSWHYLYCMHVLKAVCLLCTPSDISNNLYTWTNSKINCAWIVIFDQICDQSVFNASSNHNSMCIYFKPSLQMALFHFHCFGQQNGSKHLSWTFHSILSKGLYSSNKFFTASPKKCIMTRVNTKLCPEFYFQILISKSPQILIKSHCK